MGCLERRERTRHLQKRRVRHSFLTKIEQEGILLVDLRSGFDKGGWSEPGWATLASPQHRSGQGCAFAVARSLRQGEATLGLASRLPGAVVPRAHGHRQRSACGDRPLGVNYKSQ